MGIEHEMDASSNDPTCCGQDLISLPQFKGSVRGFSEKHQEKSVLFSMAHGLELKL
jgi:hypothetical protein